MWEFPSFGGNIRKGFDKPFEPSVVGAIICIAWIVMIIGLAYSGFKAGATLKINTDIVDNRVSLESFRPYFILSILGYIGLAYVLLQLVGSLGITGIINAIVGGQANALKNTLYSDYSAGVASLRYLSIPSAALGLYHLTRRRFIFLGFLNIIALGIVAIISSRLSIIFTIFTLLPLIINESRIKIKTIHVLIALVFIFHLLAALNYSRNIGFYRSIGIDNFYLAGFSEIITYVGSPFQGFIAAGTLNDSLYSTSDIDSSIKTGISFELSTNSAFLELVRNNGTLEAFLEIALCSFLGSFMMGISFKNKRNLLFLLFGSIGYCFAEIWRVFLFGQGIVYTISIMIILITVWCIYVPSIKFSLRNRRRAAL
ncbi:hypothetical protein Q0M94_08080 [Deinococcus radiomollis]|uniref:hypothetical protein n=1 Tax=Deinococcus radiomollis TaxID=468916 RepID=UPI003891372D